MDLAIGSNNVKFCELTLRDNWEMFQNNRHHFFKKKHRQIELNWKLSTSCLNLASSLLLSCFKKSECKSSRRCFLCSLSIHAMESTIEECTQFQKRCYEAILILYSVCTSSSEKLSNISSVGRRKDKFAYFSHIPPHTLSLWLDFITFPTKSLILKDQQMLFQLGWLFLK